MNFEKLAKEAYENAKLHGWHDEEKSDKHWLFMIITELAEVVEADRCNHHAQINKFQEIYPDGLKCNPSARKHYSKTWCQNFELLIKNSVEDELADVCIRLLDLAGLRGIDVSCVGTVLDIENPKLNNDTLWTEKMFEFARLLTSEEESVEIIVPATLFSIHVLCKAMDVDLEWFVKIKMEYNKSRSFRHGGKNY